MSEGCSICQFSCRGHQIINHGDTFRTDILYQAVANSSEAGCPICTLLCQACKIAKPELSSRSKSELWINIDERSKRLRIRIFEGPISVNRPVHVDIFTLPGEPSLEGIRVASLLFPSTRLEHTLDQIQSWERHCQKYHKRCNIDNHYMPYRLLDIMLDNPSSIKLVQLPSTATASKYACLSHCWGKTRSPHLTLHENLSRNMASIPVKELPLTFQDAVQVARALNIRYLWIDSLCIIQDSEVDWQLHVSAMARIYANAHITIAAGASSDDDGGIFAKVPPEYFEPTRYNLQISDDEQYQIYFRLQVDHPDSIPSNETLPLMKRGWCFQEELLSPRYLLFGTKEVLWECHEAVGCTCSTTDQAFNSTQEDDWELYNPSLTRTRHDIARLSKESEVNSGEIWRTMIKYYSRRQLSFSHDKLPAIAGLASVFMERANLGIYLHGMWSKTIVYDLNWYRPGSDAPPGRPRKCPSWSWVSAADGPIQWINRYWSKSPAFEVHPQLVPSLERPEAYSYALEISGTLLSVNIQILDHLDDQKNTPRFLQRECNVIELKRRHSVWELQLQSTFESGRPSQARKRSDTVSNRTNPDGYILADYKFWSCEEELQDKLQHVFFFLACKCLVSHPLHYGKPRLGPPLWQVEGMLLIPADQKSPSSDKLCRYERIGWISYNTRLGKKDWTPRGFQSRFLLV